MIALVAALLLAQAPAPRGARPAPPPAGERAPAPRRERAPDPDPAAAPRPDRAPDPSDEEVIRNLELLEQLELLRRLELFDAAGETARKEPPGKEQGKPPEPREEKRAP